MTNTYRTGNPLGSTAPKDLYDNASNFDEGMNSPGPSFVDRFGKRRETWAGFEAQAVAVLASLGYEFTNPLNYAAGIVLSRPNQIFLRDGEYYRAGPNAVLPYTTTGNWAAESSNFVSVGDAALRTQLGSSAPALGAALIGRGIQTARSAAEIRALSKDANSNFAYLAQAGGGIYELDEGDTTTGDDGGYNLVASDGGRWKAKDIEVIRCSAFGAKCDGITDDSDVFDKILAYAMTKENSVITWKGQMRLTREHHLTLTGIQSVIFAGHGSDVSQLLFTGNGNGLIVRAAVQGAWWLDIGPAPRLGFKGMSFVTRGTTQGIGLLVDLKGIVGRPQRSLIFDDVVWRGHQSFTHTWQTGLVMVNSGQAWFNNCRWIMGGPGQTSAYGIDISAESGNDAAAYYFSHCEHLYGKEWITAHDRIEGIYMTQCASGGSTRAMSWVCNISGESGLHVIGGHYNNFEGSFYLRGVNHFVVDSPLFFHSEVTPANILDIGNGGAFTITGCQFVGGPGVTNAIVVQDSPGAKYGGMIDGNNFSELGGSAIFLTPTSANITVGASNAYNACANGLVNNGINNRIHSRTWSAAIALPLAGGVTSQNVLITVPTGFFNSVPDTAELQGLANWTLGFYNRGASSPTQLSFAVRNIAGTTMTAGTFDAQVSATGKQ